MGVLVLKDYYRAGVGNFKQVEIYLNNMGEVKDQWAQCRLLTPDLNPLIAVLLFSNRMQCKAIMV